MQKEIPNSVKNFMGQVKRQFADSPKLGQMFEQCYCNTITTTVRDMEDGTSHVITGDIPAMWLRDSAAQIRPYLVLAKEDDTIRDMIKRVLSRQFQFILTDPYANAFNESANGNHWAEDVTKTNAWVWERKYETDSLCYPVQLAWLLWKYTGDTGQFDASCKDAIHTILHTFRTEQFHESKSEYSFMRPDTYYTDTLSREGKGALCKEGIGMTWSGFRPSDDSCTYGYLVPSNMFAAVILAYVKEIAAEVWKDEELSSQAEGLCREIQKSIEKYGVTEKEGYGNIYAYETDGFGQYNLMDDANVPSLLAMKYLGYRGNEEIYRNTRKMILSEANPYYYSGEQAAGIGSPHTPPGYIWHIALAVQGLTETDRSKKRELLELLADTDGGTGMMHEGFHKDDASLYTRPWFSWANAMFCELALDCLGFLSVNPFPKEFPQG